MAELIGNAEYKRQELGAISRQRQENKLLAMGKRLISRIRAKSLSEYDYPETQGWYAQDESSKRMWSTHSQTRLESHRPSFNIFR